ncbi:MAG: TonB-dependent receptor, partial [Ignavibacteriaceae bacterium]|nr:TonB-dependent receptor [Ignavibacteriaceae bacterium]
MTTLFFTNNLLGQNIGTLRGTLTDSLSGEALPFANVLIDGTLLGASTDLRGNFIITGIPSEKKYQVRISYLGYKTKTINIFIAQDQITQLRVELSPEIIRLQAIEKIGEKYDKPNETDLGLQQISIREIEHLPQGVETDIFRSLQFLPGVKSTGDVSARYYVRGGNSNQNLVLFNGVSVYNPFHALGLFSIIDPETINAIEFYRGGFTSEYGGRISSVLNLVTKDGNQNRFSVNTTVSFLTVKSTLEGPLPIGSFIISGRKSTFNQTLKKFLNYKDAPFDFHDISFKFNYASTGEQSLTKLSVHGFNSLDNLNNELPNDASYRWTNNIYGAYLFQEWEYVPIYSETNFSYSGFYGEVFPNESLAKPRKNIVNDITLKSDVTYINNSRDEIRVGYSLKSVKTELEFENLKGAGTNISKKALQIALYGKYKFLRWDDLGIDIGSRINVITLSTQRGSLLEPRINMTYRIFPWLALKGAWGLYTQDLITLTNEKEIISLFEPWVITPNYLKPLESIQYVGGIEYDGLENFSFSIEAYYKILHNTAEQNDQKTHSVDPDFIQGSGEAYGSEYLIRYFNSSVRVTGSYSLSWTYKNIDGWISYPKYDIRHSLAFNLTYNLGNEWQTSVSWFFNSGLPFTQITGYY